MLLGNIDARSGLCDGTRMIITRMSCRVLEGRVLSGGFRYKLRLIPRILSTTQSQVTYLLPRPASVPSFD